jgi:hypothetical protein
MASEFTRGDEPAPVAENETVQSSIASTANIKENKKKKLLDGSHGHIGLNRNYYRFFVSADWVPVTSLN